MARERVQVVEVEKNIKTVVDDYDGLCSGLNKMTLYLRCSSLDSVSRIFVGSSMQTCHSENVKLHEVLRSLVVKVVWKLRSTLPLFPCAKTRDLTDK